MRILSLLYSFLVVTVFNAQERPTPLRVYSADGISVKAFDFNTFEPYLNMQNDTTYVVNFWATWCTPCIKELPYFEKLNSAYKDQKVKVLLVSLDLPKQAESRLIPFMRKKNLASEVVLLDDPDANSWIEKVAFSWSGAIPATLIYNKKSNKFYERTFTYEELEAEVKQLIK